VKILVTAKRVTDPDSKIQLKPDRSGINLDNVDFKMNPFCEIAVEAALRIVDAAGDGETIVVAIGDSDATKEIRTAHGHGLPTAASWSRPTRRSSTPTPWPRVLAAIVAKEKPDLVLLGKQAIDGDSNQVGQLSPSTWAGRRPPSPTRSRSTAPPGRRCSARSMAASRPSR
jgi:electron transfer flavoprotein beta subunit